LDQREFPLLVRAGAPSAAPYQWIRYAKTYRQAVRLAWKFRVDQGMSKATLASLAGLYPQHVTDYLHEDDKPKRRDLPADKVADFERVVGNSIVSQWLAAQSKLTVLEQVQASSFAEAA
jgi:predicted transcriptional regulator